MLEVLRQDVSYALRTLRSSPIFTLVVILSLALGIGANTALFSLVDTVMLKSLPVRHPEELLQVGGHGGIFSWFFTNPQWEALHNRQQVFSDIFAFTRWRFNLSQTGEARRVEGNWVSGEYFTTLGLRPALGRLLLPSDDQRGCRPVAVISYDFWQSEYGRRNVLGHRISLDGYPFEIIGVVQHGFFGVDVGTAVRVYAPVCSERFVRAEQSQLDDRMAYWLRVIGRVKPGFDEKRATAALKVIAPQVFAEAMPTGITSEDLREYQGTLETLPAGKGPSDVRTEYRSALLVLMGAVGLVLLIACANVANLLLARAEVRRREIATRIAIGASRARLVRQFLTESLCLSLAGAAVGVLFAHWGAQALFGFLRHSGSIASPSLFLDLAINLRVLIFTAGVSVATALFFGIAPAWRGTNVNPQMAMKAGSRGIVDGYSRFGLGRMLVVFQVALSLMLAAGAVLMVKTFLNLASLDTGFDQDRVLLVIADLSKVQGSAEQLYLSLDQIRQRLTASPGVRSVSFSDVTPISGIAIFPSIEVEGFAPKSSGDSAAWTTSVSQSYFASLGTPLLAGRDFDPRDVKGAPLVAVVNEALARKFFGTESPIGRYLRTSEIESKRPIQIIGVVKDAKYVNLREEPRPTFYTSIAQVQRFNVSVFLPTNFEIRTSGRAEDMIPAIKSVIADVSPTMTFEYRTLALQVGESVNRERLLAWLSSFFSGLALLLAAVGLYGVVANSVARRHNEIGIRMALGAEPGRVLRMILAELAIMIAIGLSVGIGVAIASARLLSSLLYGVEPNDPAVLTVASGLLCIVGALAGYLPARRAGRLDPMTALREE